MSGNVRSHGNPAPADQERSSRLIKLFYNTIASDIVPFLNKVKTIKAEAKETDQALGRILQQLGIGA